MLGAGDLEKALETMETMRYEGIEPDVITYTSLIKACSLVTVVDPNYNNNVNTGSSYSSSYNNHKNDNDNDGMDSNKNEADDNIDNNINNNNQKIFKNKILENSKAYQFKPQTYRLKPLLISGKNPVLLADDLFLEMQQRDNHFSSYIAPNQLTYERYN